MLVKPAGCAACPLYTKGRGFVPDTISKKQKIRFIGEAPGTNEIGEGVPFVGKAGFVLKQWLMKAVPTLQLAFDRGEISLANTLRCLPPEIQGRPYPKGEEKEQAELCCRQYDTPLGTTETVILLGESPQRAFFGPELSAEDASDRRLGRDVKGVTGRIGRVIERDGVRYVFAPHPAYILRQPAMVQHGQEALRIASNTERMIEPAYYQDWNAALQEIA